MTIRQSPRQRGFSLVELVIVVVIIGVIAAIAVPRISRGAKGAGESAIKGSLASLRNSIDMYAAEHGGRFPADQPADTETTLINQLTKMTNASGTVGTGAGFIFGPYLRRGFPPVPVGPNVGATGVNLVSLADPTTAVDETTDTSIGWIYNKTDGQIIANTDDLDQDGVGYETY